MLRRFFFFFGVGYLRLLLLLLLSTAAAGTVPRRTAIARRTDVACFPFLCSQIRMVSVYYIRSMVPAAQGSEYQHYRFVASNQLRYLCRYIISCSLSLSRFK